MTLQHTELTDQVLARLNSCPALKGLEIVALDETGGFLQQDGRAVFAPDGCRQVSSSPLIIVLSISNTMTMSVMERTVEIGTAMALGVSAGASSGCS